MEENKLDKFFREKSEENLPEFDPKYWEQAERMLDNELPEEERRRGAWWWWLPLLLIGGCGVCWLGALHEENGLVKIDEKEIIRDEKSVGQNENTRQIDFENKTKNTDTEIISETSVRTVNSSKNNSNSLKNAIANIGQNDAPQIQKLSDEFLSVKNSINSETNSMAKELNDVPTEIAKIINSIIDGTPNLKPVIPNSDEDLLTLDLLPTLDADFLEIPITEIDDSLNIDSRQLQKLLEPKKLRLGWSAEAVVRREPFVDSVATTVASLRAGLTLDYKFNKKWDFHFDLLARRESRELTTRVNEGDWTGGKAYGFGLTEVTNLYRLKTQFFVESTALFRYKLNEHHALGLGLGAKYLFSVRADILQRNKEPEFNFNDYEVRFVNRDEVVDSGWWEKESTKDLLPFVQLRYDYRTTRHSTLFFKMNGEYNRSWFQREASSRRFRLETSFGFNYQF